MTGWKSALTSQLIEELLRTVNPQTGKKYNQSEIAAMFDVSRAWVSKLRRQNPHYTRSKRAMVLEHYPWTVPVEMNTAEPHKRLRDHGEYMATQGEDMSKDQLRRLSTFYKRLQDFDIVVEFDPSIPPTPSMSTGGFAYRAREERDGDLIIRVNEHTNLTPEGKAIWVMPPKLPEV